MTNSKKKPMGRPPKSEKGESAADQYGKLHKMCRFDEPLCNRFQKRCDDLNLGFNATLETFMMMFLDDTNELSNCFNKTANKIKTSMDEYLSDVKTKVAEDKAKKERVLKQKVAEEEESKQEILDLLPRYVRINFSDLNFDEDINQMKKLDHECAMASIRESMDKLGFPKVADTVIKQVYDNICVQRAKS